MRGNDVYLGLDATTARPWTSLVLVRDEVDSTDTIVRVDQNLAGDRMIHQLRAVVGRLVQRNGRIIFGLDRTNRNATGIARAGAAIPIGLGISRRRLAPHRERGHGRRRSEKLERRGLGVGEM